MPEHDADGGLVEDGEFESAPGFLLDDLAVGVEHFRALCFDFVVEVLDVVGFDGDLGTVLGGEFGAGDDVGLGAVAIDDCEIFVTIANFEAKTVDEEIEALVEGVVENLGDEAEHHGDIGTRPGGLAVRKVTGFSEVYFLRE